MRLFKKKEPPKPETIADCFAPPGSQYPIKIIQFDEFTQNNVQFFIIFRKPIEKTIVVSGPYYDYYVACAVAWKRGMPWLLVRTSTDDYTADTVLLAFERRYAD